MTSEADKRAMKKYMSNPKNRMKVYARNKERYEKKRRGKYEAHVDNLIKLNDREDILEYIMEHFAIKGGRW